MGTPNPASLYAAAIRPICASSRHESRGAALQYFTGSKTHNIALRDRALERGLRLNEYRALPRLPTKSARRRDRGSRSTRRSGLAWVPPELREHRGEFDAGREPCAPPLIDLRRSAWRRSHAHDRDRRQGRSRDDGARRTRRSGSTTSPSPITARRWRWPTGSTSPARSPTPRAFANSARGSTASRSWPGSNATSCPTDRSTWPPTASPNSISSSPPCTRRSGRKKRR